MTIAVGAFFASLEFFTRYKKIVFSGFSWESGTHRYSNGIKNADIIFMMKLEDVLMSINPEIDNDL